jgi:arginase
MKILLLDVPYDCGRLGQRMGAGPAFLIERGLAASLRSAGHDVRAEPVRLPDGFHTEWDALVNLQRQVAAHVREASSSGQLTLVLSGNCAPSALGAVGGLGSGDTLVIWLDAHADFNVPDTSPSGFLDGMAAAMLIGQGWRELAKAFQPGGPLPEAHMIQVGVRSVDPDEQRRLDASKVTSIGTDIATIPSLIAGLSGRVRRAYLHIDLDVIDPIDLRANHYATGGGLRVRDLEDLIETVGSRLTIGAASITALDPTLDGERAWAVAERIARTVASCATRRGPTPDPAQ